TRTVLTSTATDFHVYAELDAWEGREPAHSKTWSTTIPRDYLRGGGSALGQVISDQREVLDRREAVLSGVVGGDERRLVNRLRHGGAVDPGAPPLRLVHQGVDVQLVAEAAEEGIPGAGRGS